MHKGCVINPVLETSEIPETMPADDGSDDEGCLSVPGEGFPTGRADWAKVTGLNEKGEDIEVEGTGFFRSEEHTSELQSRFDLVCRLLLEKKKNKKIRA